MRTCAHKGFTLAEVLVASTISAFIALVAVGALKTVTDTAQVINRIGETTSEVGFAARMIARDLTNLYRDRDPRSMRLIGASQGSDNAETVFLRFYTVGRAPARTGQPEGDVYEVEYFLKEIPASGRTGSAQEDTSVLFRRWWPNPDRDRDPGGILVPVAQNIDVFQMRFYDGQQWVTEWPEELESIPKLIEVTLVTLDEESQAPVSEQFTISFARLAEPQRGGPEGQSSSSGPPPGNAGPPQMR